MTISREVLLVSALCLCTAFSAPAFAVPGEAYAQVSHKNWDMYDQGIRYLAQDDFDRAISVFRELKARNVTIISPYLALVGAYSRIGSPEDVVAAVNELTSRFPTAVRRLSHPGRRNPYYSQIFLSLGLAEMKAGHLDKAIKAFRLVLERDNHQQSFSYQMRQIFPLSALKRTEFNALVRVQLGTVYVASGDRKAAMKQYRILKKTAPDRAGELMRIIDHDQ